MVFKEFSNPLEEDYDIKSSLDSISSNNNNISDNPYMDQLVDLVGILEDDEWLGYGMSEEEYLHPTKDTIIKVKNYLANHQDKGEGIKL